jgi:hypothetical protein
MTKIAHPQILRSEDVMEETLKLRFPQNPPLAQGPGESDFAAALFSPTEVRTIECVTPPENTKLFLSRKHDRFEFSLLEKTKITVGRSETCDIIIKNDVVSRMHGYFIHTVRGFVYIDTSVNGSYVCSPERTVCIKAKGIVLPKEGGIYFGKNPTKCVAGDDLALMFAIQ